MRAGAATEAYLDIETTGLYSTQNCITVIGMYLCRGKDDRLVQLVGEKVTRDNLLAALEDVHAIYTYNGSRFDLPFIDSCLGLDLTAEFRHHDLMYDCWRKNLRGGLKKVEVQLGVCRQLTGLTGYDAVLLWHRYQKRGDRGALQLLLEYNREDVINLKTVKERLGAVCR